MAGKIQHEGSGAYDGGCGLRIPGGVFQLAAKVVVAGTGKFEFLFVEDDRVDHLYYLELSRGYLEMI